MMGLKLSKQIIFSTANSVAQNNDAGYESIQKKSEQQQKISNKYVWYLEFAKFLKS